MTAHPGGADTELGRHIGMAKFLQPLLRPCLNSALQGAWPTLMGATWPDAQPNHYYGPNGIFELAGPAKIVKGNAKSQDPERARKLWEVSEELTEEVPQRLTSRPLALRQSSPTPTSRPRTGRRTPRVARPPESPRRCPRRGAPAAETPARAGARGADASNWTIAPRTMAPRIA